MPELTELVRRILVAYGVDGYGPVAEQRAMVGVLDRMGAFAPSERKALIEAGWL
jgi:hypothetical protein